MKKSKLALLLGTLLSLFVLAGCPSPVNNGGGDNDTITVTFNNNGNVTKTLTLASGSTLTSISNQLPPEPYQSFNYFMYWSESKESRAKAVKFDYNTPITEDKTLYAIYCPKLDSYAIKKLGTTYIEIRLFATSVFPLEDGSYAGLKFERSSSGNDNTWETLNMNPPTSTRDEGTYRYLTYFFPEPLPAGPNFIKVSTAPYGSESDESGINAVANPRTITFYDNNTIKEIVNIESGTTIPSDKKPSDPYTSYNKFLYWSISKASLAEAVEFDFDTAITDDITLYAIYTPLFYSTISSLSSTQVEIDLYSSSVYPLKDGSFAGIKVLHSTDNTNYEEYAVNNPPNAERLGYLKYTFTTPLSAGVHYVKVTNGSSTTSSKRIIITEPAPVSDLTTTTDDSYVKVSFTTVEGYNSYTVKAFYDSSEIASTTISSSTTSSTEYAEFFGLNNDLTYEFTVYTDGTDKSASITASPEIKQKESDWLLVMYMDGDNNLNDPIFLDLNEAEYGLYKVRNESSSNSVNVVALWDGVVNYKDENNSTVTPQIGKSGSYLYELGTDYSSTATYINDPGCVLSSNTQNLSYTSWIVPNKTVTTSKPDTYGEVNMGNVNTLIKYLKWVNAHYKANKGIILQFSNHGGGPRSATLKNNFGRRSMCWDDTSGTDDFLRTSDVSHALNEVGFGTSKKVKMIMEDVCLGGSLEEAYELKDYAEYYIGSPNTIPGMGFDYVAFVSSLTSTANIEEIGGKLVKSYKSDYTWSDSKWNTFLTNNQGLNNANVNEIQKSVYNSSLSTLSFIDLSKIEAVKIAVEEYATLVNNATQAPADEIIKKGSDGYYYLKGNNDTYYKNGNSSEPASDSVTLTAISQKETVKYWTALAGDPLYYDGTFGSLKDLGFSVFTLDSLYHSNETTDWSPILTKANSITAALNDAIIACWRDGYNKPTYYKNPQDSSNSGLSGSWYGNDMGFGLTINCSCWVPHTGADGKTYLYEDFAEWYSNELAFGKDCSAWTNLIKDWFKK